MSERDTKLAQLHQALIVDQVLSLGQVERHYALSRTDLDLRRFTCIEAFIASTHGSTDYQKVVFVSLHPKYKKLEANTLRHLAGVAELRHLVGASPPSWHSRASARGAPQTPDAHWHTPRGRWAVEYDVGSYNPAQIRSKAESFTRYAGQVWGTPSQQRARHLRHLISAFAPHCVVVYALWC